MIKLNRRGLLPFRFMKIGGWWSKKVIDLIALNEREKKAMFFEVKWGDLNAREAKKILEKLERKSELTGLDEYTKYFGIVARKIKGKENGI